MSASLGKRAAAGVRLSFLSSVATGLIQAGILVVLARLLSPEDYGRYAIAALISRMTVGLSLGALERAMIASDDAGATNISPFVPFAITLIIFIAAAVTICFVQFFRQDGIAVLTFINLLAGLPSAFSLWSRVLLRRSLRFGPIVASELLSQVIGGGGLTIAFALTGFGSEALALGALAQSIVGSTLILIFAPIRSLVNFQWKDVRSLTGQGSSAMQSGLAELANAQIPIFSVSGILGLQSLGLFNRIYSLMQLPIEILTNSMTRVLVSSLVASRDDQARSRRALGKLVTIGVVMMSPIVGGLIGSHHEFVFIVLGSKWMKGAEIAPLLALATWFGMTAHLFGVYTEAMSLFRDKAIIQLQSGLVLGAGMVTGAFYFGLIGAAGGMVIGNLVYLLVNIRLARKQLPIESKELLSWFRPGLVAGGMAWLWGGGVSFCLAEIPPSFVLGIQISGCGVATVGYLLAFERDLLADVLGYIGLGRAVFFKRTN